MTPLDNQNTDDHERSRREWLNFLKGIETAQAGYIEFEEQRTNFAIELTEMTIDITIDFFPNDELKTATIYKLIFTQSSRLFDQLNNIIAHYEQGNNTPYYKKIYNSNIEFTSNSPAFIAEILCLCDSQEAWNETVKEFRDDYANDFYIGVYKYWIFKVIKGLVLKYYQSVYDLPALGFRELNGILYLESLQVIDTIWENSISIDQSN